MNKIEKNFNEDKLIKSSVLWMIISIGVGIALLIAGVIVYNAWGLELCRPIFSAYCLNNFSENMQFPIALITATFALAGFWALIFRSNQTQKQIQVAIDNNTFNNFIAHKKEFNEILKEIEEQNKCIIIDKIFLYEKIFPINSPVFMTFESDGLYLKKQDEKYLEFLEELYPKAIKIAEVDPRVDPEIGLDSNQINAFFDANESMEYLSHFLYSLHIKGTEFQSCNYNEQGETFTIKAPMDLKNLFLALNNLQVRISRFSNTSYKPKTPNDRLVKAVHVYTALAKAFNI
ncbi:hypothetical protein V6255_13650 [Psychromonas arctica]|uniref:Uncharacterized protein n=1 Tax=Psychromonas arctica TaxID=168275 RepID=A0ABU9HE85_9GAMM